MNEPDKPNYEAIGRYTCAIERMKECERQRNDHLENAKAIISGTLDRTYAEPPQALDLDLLQIQQAMEGAAESHDEMVIAAREANAVADLCGRRKTEIYPTLFTQRALRGLPPLADRERSIVLGQYGYESSLAENEQAA